MFVSKGKINTSIFFPMLDHEESPEKSQYDMAIPPFLDNPNSILPYLPSPPPLFQQKFSDPPNFHQFWKIWNCDFKFPPMKIIIGFFTNSPRIIVAWQNNYLNLKNICYIKLNIFLRTKLQENLRITKYLMFFTAALTLRMISF